MKKLALLTIVFLAGSMALTSAQQITWQLDAAHSKIQFKAVYMGINDIYGQFEKFEGTVSTSGGTFEGAHIEITVEAGSIDTDNDKRDGHLQSEDFLYVEEHPKIRFKSSSFVKKKDDTYTLKGDLTIRGITKSQEFEVVYKGMVEGEKQDRAAFRLTGTIDRYNYDVDWNKSFAKGLVVSKEIDIICEASLVTNK